MTKLTLATQGTGSNVQRRQETGTASTMEKMT
jgi:hypothetical protein